MKKKPKRLGTLMPLRSALRSLRSKAKRRKPRHRAPLATTWSEQEATKALPPLRPGLRVVFTGDVGTVSEVRFFASTPEEAKEFTVVFDVSPKRPLRFVASQFGVDVLPAPPSAAAPPSAPRPPQPRTCRMEILDPDGKVLDSQPAYRSTSEQDQFVKYSAHFPAATGLVNRARLVLEWDVGPIYRPPTASLDLNVTPRVSFS